MAFSPETFLYLKGLLNKINNDVASNTTSLDGKWDKSTKTLQSDPKDDMEASFTAANTLSVYSGVSSKGNGLAWYGFKINSSAESKALIFRNASDQMYIGVATRSKTGTWSFKAFM